MQSALELRSRLRQLQRKHQLAPVPCLVPLADPVAYPMILIGAAATTDQDLDRMQLEPFAFGTLPDCRSVRLLLRHDPTVVAGTVTNLDYDSRGNLRVRARVEHPEARRLGAFSAGFRVVECELRDADSEHFFGLLKRVELTEISLTDNPSNPKARVEQRIPAALSDWHTLMQQRVQLVAKGLQLVAAQTS
jgi:phage head maturation protease